MDSGKVPSGRRPWPCSTLTRLPAQALTSVNKALGTWEVASDTQHVAVAGPRAILLPKTLADQAGSGGALSIIAVMNAGSSRAAASLML